MRYFVMFWGRDARELYIGPNGTLTRDATQAEMFDTHAEAIEAFTRLPRGVRHRHLCGCKVRSRRLALVA